MVKVSRQSWFSRLPYQGILFFCLITPFTFLSTISEVSELPKRALLQTGILFFMALWLFQLAKEKKPCIQFPSLVLPFLALLLWAAASLSYAINQFEGLRHLFHYGVCTLFFFLFIHALSKDDLPALLDILIVAGLGTALLGIAQHLFLLKAVPQVAPPAATFVNKNIAADFLIITLPLAAVLFLKHREPKEAWAYALSSGIMTVFLIYTRTRAAWLAVSIEMTIILLWATRGKEKTALKERWSPAKYTALLTTIIMVLLLANLGPDGFRWQFGEIGARAASMASTEQNINRIAIWQNTLAMIEDHPFLGVGLGNHKIYYPLYNHAVLKDALFSLEAQLINVHNDFLQFIAELGMVGFPLLAWLCFVIDKHYFRQSFRHSSFEARIILAGAYAAVVGLAVSSCFGFPFQMAIPPFYLTTLLGIMHVMTSDAPRTFPVLSRRIPLYLGITAMVGAIAVGGYHYRAIIADKHALTAKRFAMHQDWNQALFEGLQAIYWAPENKKNLSEVGRAYIAVGAYDEAVLVLNDVLKSYPNLVNAQLNLAVAHTGKGEFSQAEQLYLRSLTILPEFIEIYLRLGDLALLRKNPAKAIHHYETALTLSKEKNSRILIRKMIDSIDYPRPIR
jgi:O-antigen ligase